MTIWPRPRRGDVQQPHDSNDSASWEPEPRVRDKHIYRNGTEHASIKHLKYKYPRLFKECRDGQPILALQWFPWYSLPQELRNLILHFVLVHDGPIDFWPMCGPPWDGDASTMRAALASKTKSGQLARVNKRFNCEVMPILYGQNVFRFSGANGWAVLCMFLRQISWTGQEHIRYIQANGPEFGPCCGYGRVDHSRYFNYGTQRSRTDIAEDVAKFGFKYNIRVFHEGLSRERSRGRRVKSLVANCHNLRKLELVVPSWWDQDCLLPLEKEYFDTIEKSCARVEISAIRLRVAMEADAVGDHDRRLVHDDDPQPVQAAWTKEGVDETSGQLPFWKRVKERGWTIKDALLRPDGSYEVRVAEPWIDEV